MKEGTWSDINLVIGAIGKNRADKTVSLVFVHCQTLFFLKEQLHGIFHIITYIPTIYKYVYIEI